MNGYKKSKDSIYEWVSIMVNQEYEWLYFFNDQVYDLGRFQKFGPHTRTTIIP